MRFCLPADLSAIARPVLRSLGAAGRATAEVFTKAGVRVKWVHFEQDARGRELELRYFRDTDGREVNFVLVEGRRPRLMVECKWGGSNVDRSLGYLKARFPDAEAWQISATGSKDYVTPDSIRVCPALAFLDQLI